MDLQIIKTVRPDSMGRITLGDLTSGISKYEIYEDENHQLILKPYTEIPARELWIYQKPEKLNTVRQGFKELTEGKSVALDEDLSEYLD